MVFVRVEDPWQVPAYLSRGSRGGGCYLPTEWLDTSYVGARDPCAFSWSSSGRVDEVCPRVLVTFQATLSSAQWSFVRGLSPLAVRGPPQQGQAGGEIRV